LVEKSTGASFLIYFCPWLHSFYHLATVAVVLIPVLFGLAIVVAAPPSNQTNVPDSKI
jgi:4-hydroxybenzoate polyprenyltransferase